MGSRNLLTALGLVAGAAAAWAQGQQSTSLQATVEESTVRIEGVTKGGTVALLSVWREPVLNGPHSARTNIEDTLTDDNLDGFVTYEADRTIPPVSLWVVVDTATGDAAITSPPDFAYKNMSGRAATEFRNGRVRVGRRALEVLVVRPRVGSWRGRAHDGHTGDADRVPDQNVGISLEDLDGPGENDLDGPEDGDLALRAGDVVIAIDPVEMDVLAVRLN